MTYLHTTLTKAQAAQILSDDKFAAWHNDYEAAHTLALYLEDLAFETGEPSQIVPCDIRIAFELYDSLEDYNEQHGTEYGDKNQIEAVVIDIDGTRFITTTH